MPEDVKSKILLKFTNVFNQGPPNTTPKVEGKNCSIIMNY